MDVYVGKRASAGLLFQPGCGGMLLLYGSLSATRLSEHVIEPHQGLHSEPRLRTEQHLQPHARPGGGRKMRRRREWGRGGVAIQSITSAVTTDMETTALRD